MAPKLDWKNLDFSYMQTDVFVKSEYRNGNWSELQVCSEPYLNIHAAATALHYGQACFEGLKVFTRKDGSVASFRPDQNARRMIATAKRLVMEPIPEELFIEAVTKATLLNRDWIPPYGTGASMYVRPLLIGSGPRIGVNPAETYLFLVMVMPVGPYYKTGFRPVRAVVQEVYDRAAPRGVGNVKAGGNYAAGMIGDLEGKKNGYPICLYLDSAQHLYVDEFGTSNFLGITKSGAYVTPDSNSILPSVTNASLQVLAADMGLKVERRPVRFDELREFAEVGACGTAAVITPVYSITRGSTVLTFGKENDAGPTLTKLFQQLQAIQYGDVPDRHGWMLPIK